MTIRLIVYVKIPKNGLNSRLKYLGHVSLDILIQTIENSTWDMVVRIVTYIILLAMPLSSYCVNPDVRSKLEVLDVYNQKVKGDSLLIDATLDSAKYALARSDYNIAVDYAERTFELSKKFPDADFSIQSILILARANKGLYLLSENKDDFNSTLKYYLKAITALESVDSKWLLPKIYKEYGDFYLQLNLTELTIKNYKKAYELVKAHEELDLKKEIIEKLAILNYQQNDLTQSIYYYGELRKIHETLYEEVQEIDVLKMLSQLYRENYYYDSAIATSKIIHEYCRRISDKEQQISYQSLIAEISYEAGNNDQADQWFKNYFSTVKKDQEILEKEIASLRYIRNLVTEGDIYAWSTENGYWSDYETSIRYYNDAQKYIDSQLYPELASKILNRAGSIFFKKGDYKTCITYFDLALYYAQKSNNLEYISENHINLARGYDAIALWEEASEHYELHSAYKDTIIQAAAVERQKIAEQLIEIGNKNLKVEQTLDNIEAQEIQELAVAQKELRNIALENELELYRQDAALKEMLIQNQQLAEEKAKHDYLLTKEQLENELNSQKIEKLNSERENQKLLFENQTQDQEVKQQRIKILEQENTLARSQKAYYLLSIILISLFMGFILVIYIQKRKANIKLKTQNEKIASQSDKLKQAYKNLELLSTIGRDITSTLIIEEIIETVYENLNTLMDASVLGIGVYDQSENQLRFPGVREKNQRLDDINIDLSNNSALATYCFNSQEEIILDNYFESYSDYINPVQKPVSGDGNSTSVIYLPLTIGTKKLGVLTLQSFYEGAFNEYHINIIRNIAIYTKIALENANVYRELELRSHDLQLANNNIVKQHMLIEEQNQQLVSINNEKNNLMRILAHDLRNPLATAMSMTELMRYDKGNLSAEQYQASEIIWRGLNRMDDMIRKILDIKAVESQKVNLDFEAINANELINPLEKLFAIKAAAKQIKLHFSRTCEEPIINVDRHYLIQVMENLISNALKFSSSHKNIFINVSDDEHYVRISVRDEGPGIPDNDFPKLFKKYQKLSPQPTGGEQSIGLGLSIVKKYVEVMKGQVRCKSKIGKGTEFIVEFKKEPVSVS